VVVGAGAADRGKQREGILLVDDDKVLVDLLAYLADQAGFKPLVASDPTSAIAQFEGHDPLVAVIDLNLKPWDGFELLADLRGRSATLPILVLTARADEDDKVKALDLGADDYVVKPFGHREFLARLRAHARRALRERGTPVRHVAELGAMRLDAGDHTLRIGDDVHRLTGTEFRLLEFLMRHGSAVVPMGAVAKHVCGFDDAPARESVRVTVHRLRRKLGDDATQQRFIHTVPGIGLQLNRVEDPERATS
jgi:two-component system KDP operon response regulator KdpE